VQSEKKVKFNYSVGTMIEVPRGALTADEIAQTAEFFSFGTNDLTQTALVHEVAAAVQKEKKVKIAYSVGTMIEIPRGALTADEIANTAQFFSFGTNDLTQTCLGMSRDDSGSFLGAYTENEIVKKNPFASIDQTGVGQLIKIAVEKGNKTRPGIKLGICGEHGGDPDSVKFCHNAGLTYVSCSPFRVPVARLAAAQAAVEEKRAAAKKK